MLDKHEYQADVVKPYWIWPSKDSYDQTINIKEVQQHKLANLDIIIKLLVWFGFSPLYVAAFLVIFFLLVSKCVSTQ